jgi:hypothetical protein
MDCRRCGHTGEGVSPSMSAGGDADSTPRSLALCGDGVGTCASFGSAAALRCITHPLPLSLFLFVKRS